MIFPNTYVRQLKARYCRFLDTKQWERLKELFAADARFDGFTSVPDGSDPTTFVNALSTSPGRCDYHPPCADARDRILRAATGSRRLAANGLCGIPDERSDSGNGNGPRMDRVGLLRGGVCPSRWRLAFFLHATDASAYRRADCRSSPGEVRAVWPYRELVVAAYRSNGIDKRS